MPGAGRLIANLIDRVDELKQAGFSLKELREGQFLEPLACEQVQAGTIRFDHGTRRFQGCDGVAWSLLAFCSANAFSMACASTNSWKRTARKRLTRKKPPAMTMKAQNATTRGCLVAFYQQHDPSKLVNIDRLLTGYKGRERRLVELISQKYPTNPSLEEQIASDFKDRSTTCASG